MLSGAPAEEHAYAESFLFVEGHESFLSCWAEEAIILTKNSVISGNAEKGKRGLAQRLRKRQWRGEFVGQALW
jgi:hypothetical protein